MPVEVVTIACLSDNYAYLLHDDVTGETALIDVPEARPILEALRDRNWSLSEVWITHHHDDHVQGIAEILETYPAIVRGAAKDNYRLPKLNYEHEDEEHFSFAGHDVRVMDVSGHTIGHISYYVSDANAVFTADSLMALGCGRLFEGTPKQMWSSLSKLSALPSGTIVCSGHEYTAANARFALTIDPNNVDLKARAQSIQEARDAGKATVPSILDLELATNPFLRASNPAIRAQLNMKTASDVEVFAEIRARKDAF